MKGIYFGMFVRTDSGFLAWKAEFIFLSGWRYWFGRIFLGGIDSCFSILLFWLMFWMFFCVKWYGKVRNILVLDRGKNLKILGDRNVELELFYVFYLIRFFNIMLCFLLGLERLFLFLFWGKGWWGRY